MSHLLTVSDAVASLPGFIRARSARATHTAA